MEDQRLDARVVAKQVLVAVVAVTGAICSGGSLAFSAVALPQLQDGGDNIGPEQASWFASVSSMCTPVGCVMCGVLLDRLGRRAALLLVGLPFLVGWLLLALCPVPAEDHAAQLYAGRVFTGLATGLASVPATVYLGETSPPRLRASFVTWTSLSISGGILLAYALGAALTWRAAAGAWAALPAAALLLTWALLPESPAWLARRGRAADAEAALRRLRGQPARGPLSPAVARELEALRRLPDVASHHPKADTGPPKQGDLQAKASALKGGNPEDLFTYNAGTWNAQIANRVCDNPAFVEECDEYNHKLSACLQGNHAEALRDGNCDKKPPQCDHDSKMEIKFLSAATVASDVLSYKHTSSRMGDDKRAASLHPPAAFSRAWTVLKEPTVWKPLLLLNVYFLFMQLAGVYVVVSYAVDIVRDAGVAVDAYMATVILGGVQLVSSIVVSYVVTRCGRRPLSIISGAGMMLCMLGLSIYLQFADLSAGNDSPVTVLPLVLMVLYVVFGAVGFHTLPWALLGELFPAHARGAAAGATTCLAYLENFAALKLYPALSAALTADRGDGEYTSRDVFLFFAATSLAGTVFVALLLPETFGCSLRDIEDNFRHHSIIQVCSSERRRGNPKASEGV